MNIDKIENGECYCPTHCIWSSYDPKMTFAIMPTETITREEVIALGISADELQANTVINESLTNHLRYVILGIHLAIINMIMQPKF